jgi:4-hydroxy-2-oxoheptanedioate aldolase
VSAPRLNGIIRAFEQGKPAFGAMMGFDVEGAIAFSTSGYDSLMLDGEHGPWNPNRLRDCLQYLLNRASIAASGSIAPAVTPICRIPPNGGEISQLFAKQALDLGVYGVVWPHISTVEQAYNAVAACGVRGDGPAHACRYWGLAQHEYYQVADVWPLDPHGEMLTILQIEDARGIENLDAMLREVPGIGMILIGEGDLSQELGCPRQYDHPEVLSALAEIVATCGRHGVAVGHPHVSLANIEGVLAQGYSFLMMAPAWTHDTLAAGRRLTTQSRAS